MENRCRQMNPISFSDEITSFVDKDNDADKT